MPLLLLPSQTRSYLFDAAEMILPLILIVMTTPKPVFGGPAIVQVDYCLKGFTAESTDLWSQTPYKATPITKAFQPNPAIFRTLGIGQPCSSEAARNNWGIDPGCLVNRTLHSTWIQIYIRSLDFSPTYRDWTRLRHRICHLR